MSRTARQIAESGLSDLCCIQQAFNELHASYQFLKERVPAGDLGEDIAELGIAAISDHAEKVWQWAECMENELFDLGLPEECAQ